MSFSVIVTTISFNHFQVYKHQLLVDLHLFIYFSSLLSLKSFKKLFSLFFGGQTIDLRKIIFKYYLAYLFIKETENNFKIFGSELYLGSR